MTAYLSILHRLLVRGFQPVSDPLAVQGIRKGKSPWVDMVHLLWTALIFITPAFDSGAWNLRWGMLTLLSCPMFLLLYAGSVVASRRLSRTYAKGWFLPPRGRLGLPSPRCPS